MGKSRNLEEHPWTKRTKNIIWLFIIVYKKFSIYDIGMYHLHWNNIFMDTDIIIFFYYNLSMYMTLKQATSGAIIIYEMALWLEPDTVYVVAIMMMMHAWFEIYDLSKWFHLWTK